MTNANDKDGNFLSDAGRLTRYGKFLRNTNLDELPEFFNILKLEKLKAKVLNYRQYFPVVFDGYKYTRDEICEKLKEHDIVARKYFYPITNAFDCYKDKHDAKAETPVAYGISFKVVTLPLYADLSLDDVDKICDIILD